MQTNQQFDLAFNLLQNTGTNLFLTGKAGTGKTTFLKRLKEVSPKRMIVVAPTGVAASSCSECDKHSGHDSEQDHFPERECCFGFACFHIQFYDF